MTALIVSLHLLRVLYLQISNMWVNMVRTRPLDRELVATRHLLSIIDHNIGSTAFIQVTNGQSVSGVSLM